MRINLTLSQLKLNNNHIFYINASLNALLFIILKHFKNENTSH